MSCRLLRVSEFGAVGAVLVQGASSPVDLVRRVRWLFTLANANARGFAATYPHAPETLPIALSTIAQASLDMKPTPGEASEAMAAITYNCQSLTEAEERILVRVRESFYAARPR